MAEQSAINFQVSPKEATGIIEAQIRSNIPVMIWGPPGCSKSAIVASIAKKQGRRLIDLRMLLLDPTDIKGIPYYNSAENAMVWAPPGELPLITTQADVDSAQTKADEIKEMIDSLPADALRTELLELKKQHDIAVGRITKLTGALEFQDAILFLDELPAAPQATQASAFQLVLDRKVGEYTLPPGVRIIGAGNRITDKGAAYKMPTPLANRFTHITMKTNFEDWQEWAIESKVNAGVIGFLSSYPNLLNNFEECKAETAFATPRSWHMVSNILNDGDLPSTLLKPVIAGTVGINVTSEFFGHLDYASKLPKPADILSGKVKTLAPEMQKKMSAIYTLSLSLCFLIHERLGVADSKTDTTYTKEMWIAEFDNFLGFIMDAFPKREATVLAAKTIASNYKIRISQPGLKNYERFFNDHNDLICGVRSRR